MDRLVITVYVSIPLELYCKFHLVVGTDWQALEGPRKMSMGQRGVYPNTQPAESTTGVSLPPTPKGDQLHRTNRHPPKLSPPKETSHAPATHQDFPGPPSLGLNPLFFFLLSLPSPALRPLPLCLACITNLLPAAPLQSDSILKSPCLQLPPLYLPIPSLPSQQWVSLRMSSSS